ncbi:hypothetical protein B0H19DRAFT_1060080 [Mycena capillaripes]|nr:hypothetical protein B0H19DRAFT_1060080 [Mycena capillaripes]
MIGLAPARKSSKTSEIRKVGAGGSTSVPLNFQTGARWSPFGSSKYRHTGTPAVRIFYWYSPQMYPPKMRGGVGVDFQREAKENRGWDMFMHWAGFQVCKNAQLDQDVYTRAADKVGVWGLAAPGDIWEFNGWELGGGGRKKRDYLACLAPPFRGHGDPRSLCRVADGLAQLPVFWYFELPNFLARWCTGGTFARSENALDRGVLGFVA